MRVKFQSWNTGKDALASHTRVCRPCWTLSQEARLLFFLPSWVFPFPTSTIALPQLLFGIFWLTCYPWMVGNSFLFFHHNLLMLRAFHLVLPEGLFGQFCHSPISTQHSLESWFVRWCCFSKTGWFTFDQAQLILKQPNINERSPELHLAVLFFLHSRQHRKVWNFSLWRFWILTR